MVFQPLRAIAFVFCVIVVTVSGCSSGDPEAKARHEQPLSLADLDMDGWVNLSTDSLPQAPRNPNKVPAAKQERAELILHRWASAALGDPEQTLDSAPKDVRHELELMADAGPARGVSLGTGFGEGLTVKSRWGTGVWKETSAAPLHLEYQTRVLWELEDADGQVRLVGMVRTHVLVNDGESISIGQSWQEFGADDCALVVEETIRPGGDVAEQNKDLRRFEEIANSAEVVSPDFSEDDVVDQEFANRCRAGAT